MKKEEKIIGIGGGVGPEAGIGLHKKIIEQTDSGGTDQGHIEVYHLSRSHDIADRTEFLLKHVDNNPAEGMFNTAQALTSVADETEKELVLGIPCNTFHAPEIFNHFLGLLKKNNLNIQVVNMLEETVQFIKDFFPGVKKLGLMSTTGTRKVKIYNKIFEPLGLEIIEVPDEMQEELHDTIYNQKWGIKAVSPVSKKARDNFLKFSGVLNNQDAEAIILGCTEIPLALPEQKFENIPLIDPVLILARALIREAAESKLRSLII